MFEAEEGTESHRRMSADGSFIEIPSSPEESPATTTEGEGLGMGAPQELEKMTVAQLRIVARDRNITLSGNLSKSQIVALLQGLGV